MPMFIIHDIRHAELDAHTLLEPRSILKARENAINDAEEYVRGTEEYCKAMSRHLAYDEAEASRQYNFTFDVEAI
jgi:hypothetical protein